MFQDFIHDPLSNAAFLSCIDDGYIVLYSLLAALLRNFDQFLMSNDILVSNALRST